VVSSQVKALARSPLDPAVFSHRILPPAASISRGRGVWNVLRVNPLVPHAKAGGIGDEELSSTKIARQEQGE
jgi:hypothetical protein